MIYNPRNWTQQKVRKKKIPVLMLILKGVYSWNKGVYSWNKMRSLRSLAMLKCGVELAYIEYNISDSQALF